MLFLITLASGGGGSGGGGGAPPLEGEIRVDGARLKQVSEFKYLGCVLDKSGTDAPEYRRKVTNRKKVASAIRFLVNARGLQVQCARLGFVVPVLLYGNKTMVLRKA